MKCSAEGKYLSADTAVLIGDRIFTVDIDTWFFVSYDLRKDDLSIIADLRPLVPKTGKCRVSCLLYHEERFYIIERNSCEILTVDLSGNVSCYGEDNRYRIDRDYRVTGSLINGNTLYLLPGNASDSIVSFCLVNHVYHKLPSMVQLLGNNEGISTDCLAYRYKVNNHTGEAFCVLSKTNLLVRVCFPDLRAEIKPCLQEASFYVVMPNDNRILISEYERQVLWEYIPADGIFTCITQTGDSKYPEQYLIAASQKDGRITALNDLDEVLDIYDKSGRLEKKLPLPAESELIREIRNYDRRFTSLAAGQGTIIYSPFCSNGFCEYDHTNGTFRFHRAMIPREMVIAAEIQNYRKITEREGIGLKEFISLNKLRFHKRRAQDE